MESQFLLVPSTTRGRYSLNHPLGRDLTSGDAIAIWLNNSWTYGSIERGGSLYVSEDSEVPLRGYYFVADDEEGTVVGLCVGMKVKIPGLDTCDEWYFEY